MAPDIIKKFILENVSHQVKTHGDCDTTGEGYDYRMEEVNKAFKENLSTKEPTIEDWSLVCSNTNVLKTMKEMQLHDYQVGKASSGAWAPDYAARIEFCQSKIREMKHLKFDNNCHLVNARGDRLSSDCVRLMETC